ncbi:pirin [Spirosoma sp. BT702]|uniref:Pirin n=1 Tax=Spirosoma profusum TaxID=2771354 RepID=A0A926Y078_9BACT|nr:pirin [Spirosoma profusum]MBD2704184.1 pirin [Spirosoma profusum]
MDRQTQAQIYLADQRGQSQVDFFNSFHSFNFGQYVAESREPFGALQVLNDDQLKPGRSIGLTVEQNTEVIILPLVGGLEYKSDVGNGFLETGQVQVFSLTGGMSYQISNPYDTEVINYIVIWQSNASPDFQPGLQTINFDLQQENQLLPLFDVNANQRTSPLSFHGYIGRYVGRAEDIYHLERASDGTFIFVLSGAFEVQNRLLHERDGLALSNIKDQTIDWEALSNNALLLLLEVPLDKL